MFCGLKKETIQAFSILFSQSIISLTEVTEISALISERSIKKELCLSFKRALSSGCTLYFKLKSNKVFIDLFGVVKLMYQGKGSGLTWSDEEMGDIFQARG